MVVAKNSTKRRATMAGTAIANRIDPTFFGSRIAGSWDTLLCCTI
jgi:hypothetical protein